MAKVAETYLLYNPATLSNLNDIWNNTFAVGLSHSNNQITIFSNDFRYKSDLEFIDYLGNISTLPSFEFPPRPKDLSGLVNGYGAFSITSPLKSFFRLDFNSIYITSPTQSKSWDVSSIAGGPLLKYRFKSGFQFNPNLFVEAFEGIVGGDSFLGFTFSVSNPFVDNSRILVISDNPYISGSHTISSDNFTSSFLTTTAFTSSMNTSTPDATIINYSQEDFTSTYYWGLDCRLSYKDFTWGVNSLLVDDTILNWKDSTTYKFLNSYPNRQSSAMPGTVSLRGDYFNVAKNIKTNTNSYETLSFVIDTDASFTDVTDIQFIYELYDKNYNLLQQQNLPLSLTTGQGLVRMDVPIGWQNLSSTFASPDDVVYLVCYLSDSNFLEFYTEYRIYKFDRTCSIYDPKHLMFKNKFGAWDFWTFTQDTKETIEITRNEYKKEIPWGNFINTNGFYRGRNIYGGKVEKSYTLNTNWITETEYSYLSDLMESSDVYILEFYPQLNKWLPVPIIITDTTYELKTAFRDEIFNLTLNYIESVETPLQNGQ